MFALDPPFGITVTGNQVFWLSPLSTVVDEKANRAKSLLQSTLNNMLSAQNFIGYGRVRVRLIGGAVYGSGTSGNIYLDGQSLGQTFNRTLDQSPAVAYNVPSGGSAAVSDYEGWFYLAPTLLITSVVIQGLEGEQFVTIPAINVFVDSNNNITGLQAGLTESVRTCRHRSLSAIRLSLPSSSPSSSPDPARGRSSRSRHP